MTKSFAFISRISAVAFCIFATLTASAVNEPDFYVEWIGHAGGGPVTDPGHAFKVMPRIELGMTLSNCGDCDVAGNSAEGAGKIIMDYSGNGSGLGLVRFGGGKNV